MGIIRGSVVGLAGLVGVGMLAFPLASTATDREAAFLKRDEQATDLVLVADDDDDDTNDDSKDSNDTDTGVSRSTNDNTRSNFTKVSRDRDLSRGDKTRDWTRDGGKKQRDWSANTTNDRSRNDSRGRR